MKLNKINDSEMILSLKTIPGTEIILLFVIIFLF